MVQIALRTKLDRARSYWRALAAVEGLGWTAGIMVIAALLCFYVDHNLILTAKQRVGAWALGGVLLAAAMFFLVIRAFQRPRSDEQIATLVEKRYPQLGERLLSTVEFSHTTNPAERGLSAAMIEALGNETANATQNLDFRTAFAKEGIKRSVTGFGVTLLVFGIHLAVMPNAMGAFFQRMLHPFADIPVWRDTRVFIEPLHGKRLKGGTLDVTVRLEGKTVPNARFRFQLAEGAWANADLKADEKGLFHYRFANLTEDLHYFALAGDGQSNQAEIDVVDPPAVVGATLTYQFPAYQERKAETVQAPSAGIAAPVGTTVTVELKANKQLASANIEVEGQAPLTWAVSGDTARGQIRVMKSGNYTVKFADTDGFTNPAPQTFPIKALADQTPEVQLVEPTGDLEVVPDALVPLTINVKDDYGVGHTRVAYERDNGKKDMLGIGIGGPREKTVGFDAKWDLAQLNLKPGDSIRYRAEAQDYDNITGPHTGKTGEYTLRIIDKGTAERRINERRAELMAALKDLIREQKYAKADVDEQKNAANPNPENIAAAESRQRALASKATDLSRQMAELNRMAETNRMATPQQMDAQKRAQQAMTNLANQNIPQAANQIAQAQPQAQATPQGAKQDLNNASAQQQEILKQLEQIQRDMQPGSPLQQLADRADRLAKAQADLQKQSQAMIPQTLGKSMEELTPQQRQKLADISAQQRNLEQATQQLQQDIDKAGQQASDPQQQQGAQQASQAMRQAGIPQKQQQAAQQAQQNSLGQAATNQQQAAKDLKQVAQQLRQSSQANNSQQSQQSLQQAMAQLGQMMQQQREAIEQTKQNPDQQQRRQLAQLERDLKRQAEEVKRQLQQLQRQAPAARQAAQAMQQAQQSLQQASQSLSQPSNSPSQQQQNNQKALQQEQNAQRQMQRAMNSAQQAQQQLQQEQDPFAEIRKELQKLSQEQKAIQGATERIDEVVKNGGLEETHKQDLQGLARRQQRLEDATQKVEKKLPTEVFKHFSERARQAMTRAEGGLKNNNPSKSPTQLSENRAASLIDQLIKALEKDPEDNEMAEGGGGGGGGGGQQKPDPELPKRLAELRLLRAMQRSIKQETEELDAQREPRQPLTPEQEEQARQLAQQQESARQMAQRTAQALSRYRPLQRKVAQAGGHMEEAQGRLAKQNTGDATQQEEEKAVIQLTQALKMTQQIAQQQQQQQQQQQGGQQAGRQQGGQPGQGQQQGSQPGQGQQGSSPAMQSVQRRTGASDPQLGGLSAIDRARLNLDPRSMDSLRQAGREKKPAEYEELINRYYKALSDKGGRR